MSKSYSLRNVLTGEIAVLLYLAMIKLIIHLLTANKYGYFTDEFYTIACGKHLMYGLVDIPPLVPFLSLISGKILGYSLFNIHILPALAGALTVFIAGLTAREMGGGRFAQFITAVTVLLGPVWLCFNSIFTYDGFDQLISIIFFYLIVRLLRTGNGKLWLAVGAAAGIAVLTKYTMLFYGFPLVIGLILTKNRKYFLNIYFWLGGLIALFIVAPLIFWEFQHGWPLLEYWGNYEKYRTFTSSPAGFIVMQIMAYNPLNCLLWLSGLIYFFFKKEANNYRLLGIIYVAAIVVFYLTNAKIYMSAAIYPALFAGGGILLERSLCGKFNSWIKFAYLSIVIVMGIISLPNGLPVFPPEGMAMYFSGQARMIGSVSVKIDNSELQELPIIYAYRFGWEETVKEIADIYSGLSPDEKAKCMLFAGDTGDAGAIDLLGKKYGLPDSVCGHLSYALWGYHENTGEIAIAIAVPEKQLNAMYDHVTEKTRINVKYSMPWRRDLPIYICRGLKSPIDKIWPGLKHFD